MILRSLRVVNLRGLTELDEPRLSSTGLVRITAREPVGPQVLQEVLRFALEGDPGALGDWLSPAAQFGFAEVGLVGPDGHGVSVFRGIDGRDSVQVSLREDGGRGLTSGSDAVHARLVELMGEELETWIFAACPPSSATDDPVELLWQLVPEPALAGAPPSASAPAEPTSARPPSRSDVSAARAAVDQAVEGLRRAVQLEVLLARADRCHLDLVAFGEELERRRAEVAERVHAHTGERERLRGKLRRLAQYRDELEAARVECEAPAQAPVEPAAPIPAATPAAALDGFGAVDTSPSRALEWGLLFIAVLQLVFFLVVFDAEPGWRTFGLVITGVCFVTTATAYVRISRRRAATDARNAARAEFASRPEAPAPPPAAVPAPRQVSAADWRGPVRARFGDLDDPDDPQYGRELRERLDESDVLVGPLRVELEQLDDALALYQSELAKAGRALSPSTDVPPAAPRERHARRNGDREAERRVRAFGDAIYEAAIEHEALMAGGAETRAAALAKVRAGFQRMGRALGVPGWGDPLLHGLPLDALVRAAADQDPLGEVDGAYRIQRVWGELQAVVDREIERALAAGDARDANQLPVSDDPEVARVARRLGALLGGRSAAFTGAAWDSVTVGPGPELSFRSTGSGTATSETRWTELPARERARLAFALRVLAGLRKATQGAGAATGAAVGVPRGRTLLLAGVPAGFGSAEELTDYLGRLVPECTQVVLLEPRRPTRSGLPVDPAAGGRPPPTDDRGAGNRGGETAGPDDAPQPAEDTGPVAGDDEAADTGTAVQSAR